MTGGVFGRLIEELKRLPGIGQKTAQRLAFFILKMPSHEAKGLAQAVVEVKDRLKFCALCRNISEEEICSICRNPSRDHTRILVVKEPSTLYAIERTGEYKGLYHVLVGTFSPLDGQPDGNTWMSVLDVKAKELLTRLQAPPMQALDEVLPEGPGEVQKREVQKEVQEVQEVILATDPTMEGEATALYLTKLIKPLGIKITRIALGIPVGVDLEYVDEVTLIKSLEGRREV